MRDDAAASRPRRLAAEYVIVFFVLVGAYLAARPPGGPIPPLVLAAGAALVYLRRQPGFDRRDLLRAGALRPALPGILLLWVPVTLVTTAAVAAVAPERLFDMPRQDTALWAAVIVGYPLLSVYPQEVLFRAFLLHRYAPVFGRGATAAAASAAAFGFTHVIFGSGWSVLLTVVGGWLFARRYQRTRSLLVATVEHTLYGVLAFTVGLGDLFYDGDLAAGER